MRRKKMTPKVDSTVVESPSRSPEQFIEGQLAALKTNVQCCLDDVAAHTQLHPHQSLLWALGTGYVLRVLPTTRILGGAVRLSVALLKPAALIYGAAKLWHATQKSAPQKPATR